MKNNKQPLLFFGHGSPMNAIEDNTFSRSWREMGEKLNPTAILVVSAHWETKEGSFVFNGQNNTTIHDFFGVPQKLFQVQYPAPASPSLAETLSLKVPQIKKTEQWGLDHGAWSVLTHAFPQANIPTIQLSLSKKLSPLEHFNLAKELSFLRQQGVLIIGSGNIVHNLRVIDWSGQRQYDWAHNTQEEILKIIKEKSFPKLVEIIKTTDFQRSHPTIEHYLPLLYAFALAQENEDIIINTPSIELASISMASFVVK